MTNRLGQQLGSYRLIHQLGEGGFAEIYLGEHIYLRTQAAIKVLKTRLISDDLVNFLTEARTIAGLTHPHIVRVLDFGVEEQNPFLVMEYAPNGTLRQRHPKGTLLSLPSILPYVKQVADALQYAHDKKLIHRDVKPENMLLGRSNEVLLSDFGIALAAQSSLWQSTQAVAGTPYYMAPEQVQGKPLPASDQYALGVVVYEWLSGERPFRGTFSEIATQHIFAPPPPLREKVPTLAPDVEQVVLTALAKNPKERFASILAFANALEQANKVGQSLITPIVSGIPQSNALLASSTLATSQVNTLANFPGVPEGTLPNMTPSLHSTSTSEQLTRSQLIVSRRAVLLGLAGLAVVSSGLTWVVLNRRPGNPSSIGSTPTPVAFTTSTPTATSIPTSPSNNSTALVTYRGHTAQTQSITWSPDGARIASGSWDSTVQVWDAATGKLFFTYNKHIYHVWAVEWSPNGNFIASAGDDRTVQVWNPATGSTLITYPVFTGVKTVAWSPDSTRIASGGGDKMVQVWNAVTGKLLFTCTGHTARIWAVAWSPNGARIASASSDKTVKVWDANTGNLLFTYAGHSGEVRCVAWSSDSTRIASGSYDSTVQVWDALTGDHALTYTGHRAEVWAMAWSPDGELITSGSPDRTARVWKASSGSDIVIYRGHANAVIALVWAHDSMRVASGSSDKTVQVWKAT